MFFLFKNILVVSLLSALITNKVYGHTSPDFIVSSFEPSSNYINIKDIEDVQQLTDGLIVSEPMWRYKGAVGWRGRTPIKISLSREVEAVSSKGILRIHSAKGLYAGVKVPRQIDVYKRINQEHFSLITSKMIDPTEYEDEKSHWIDVKLEGVESEIVVVIHSRGKFIFIDEIEWHENKSFDEHSSIAKDAKINNVIKDSIKRLKRNLLSENKDLTSYYPSKISNKFNNGLGVWLQNPWVKFGKNFDTDIIEKNSINIYGISTEKETVCIGVHNNTDFSKKIYMEVLNDDKSLSSAALNIKEVVAIQSFDGGLVYDPLVDFKSSNEFELQAHQTKYIWLTVDLSLFDAGETALSVNFSENKTVADATEINFNITLSVLDKVVNSYQNLSVFNWAYVDNLPIWKNQKIAYEDLKEHGVNVFVLPPRAIPGLNLDKKWEATKNNKMEEMLNLFKDDGMVLLFLGWGINKNPLGYTTRHQEITENQKKALEEWLVNISKVLKESGLGYKQWALYPIDEFNKSSLSLLRQILKIIKEFDSNIQVYVNPSNYKSRNKILTINDLASLEKYVDIWQPKLGFVRGVAEEFYSDFNGEWWIYHNPVSPAKAASPLYDYRLISWWAWKLEAKGVGFWSYDDTRKTSAWDDFDGNRADWSVVYEGDASIISSRRWEAFREGIEDYNLLDTNTLIDRDSVNLNDINLEGINALRRKVFNNYVNQ